MRKFFAFFTLAVVFVGSPLWAADFLATRSAGMGGTGIAMSDNAAPINAAGLAQVKDFVLHFQGDFTRGDGRSDSIYSASLIPLGTCGRFGTLHLGRAYQDREDTPESGHLTEMDLQWGYALSEQWSIGLAFSYTDSEHSSIDNADVEGEHFHAGLGVQYRVNDTWRVGGILNARWGDWDGKWPASSFVGSFPLASLKHDGDIDMDIEAGLGVALDLNPTLTLAADMAYRHIERDYGVTARYTAATLLSVATLDEEIDSYAFRMGLEKRFYVGCNSSGVCDTQAYGETTITLRAGYTYVYEDIDGNTDEDDNGWHAASVGVGFEKDHFLLDTAAILREGGKWSTSVSVGYTF